MLAGSRYWRGRLFGRYSYTVLRDCTRPEYWLSHCVCTDASVGGCSSIYSASRHCIQCETPLLTAAIEAGDLLSRQLHYGESRIRFALCDNITGVEYEFRLVVHVHHGGHCVEWRLYPLTSSPLLPASKCRGDLLDLSSDAGWVIRNV